MRISDWSSDVCSSDLAAHNGPVLRGHDPLGVALGRFRGSEAGARVTTRWRSFEGTASWAEGRLEEAGGLNGWRRGVLRVAGWPTLVYDRPPGLPCDAEVACHWQLAPEAVVARRAARQVTADLGGVSAYLCASEGVARSEEHTSELQSLMRTPYAVF